MNNDEKRVIQGATTVTNFFDYETNEKTITVDNEYFEPVRRTVGANSLDEMKLRGELNKELDRTRRSNVRKLKPFWKTVLKVVAAGGTIVLMTGTVKVIIDKFNPTPIEEKNDDLSSDKAIEAAPLDYEQSLVKAATEKYPDFYSLSDDDKYKAVVSVENDLMSNQTDDNTISR